MLNIVFGSKTKNVTISAEERGNNDIFVPTSITADYTRSSVPIDSTDILRSIPAICRELHFTININLHDIPQMVQNNAQVTFEYLRLTDSSCHFSSSILKVLIKDRRTAHAECINNTRILVVLKYSNKNALHIEFYNVKWFNKPLPPSAPQFTYKDATLQIPNDQLTPFPSLVKFHKYSNTSSPKQLLEDTDHIISHPLSPLALYNSILHTDYLFLLWFLVQVNHEGTTTLRINLLYTGYYHVYFFSRHLDDSYLCNNIARWLLE